MSDLIAVAHRGFSARYFENTRLSHEAAIVAGAHYIESDARLTRDGTVICCHDPNLERLTGTKTVIAETDAADLLAIDVGEGHHLLRLSDVLEIARGRARMFIDMKTRDVDLSDAVWKVVTTCQAVGFVRAGTRSLAQLRHLMSLSADAECVAMTSEYDEIPAFLDGGARAVRVWEDDLEHPAAASATENHKPVWVTAGRRSDGEAPGFITPERLNRLRDLGIEAVLLNDPTLITGHIVDSGS